MENSFDYIWKKIQNELKLGQIIRNWGLDKGYTGNNFKIFEKSYMLIICDPPKAKYLQKVPKEDFKKVWDLWPDYISGKIKRHYLRDDITRFSSYIISIIHEIVNID